MIIRHAASCLPTSALVCFAAFAAAFAHNQWTPRVHVALQANRPVAVDGDSSDAAWRQAHWDSLSYGWLPDPNASPDKKNAYAWFKTAWSPATNRLYIIVKIRDDLYHPGKDCKAYFCRECVEVFLDPNHRGGDYKGTFNAFCYHIVATGSAFMPYSAPNEAKKWVNADLRSHLSLAFNPDSTIWEMALTVYEKYAINQDSVPKALAAGDTIGFSIAYNDEDDGDCRRDGMIGWVRVQEDDSWRNADVFGHLVLGRGKAVPQSPPNGRGNQ